MLKGKKILLGVTGSIAAYKSAYLTRLLVKEGAKVKVVFTPSAKDFITPLTLSTLSNNPVFSDFTSDKETGEWNNHVELGLWADVFLIAPATANTLSKAVTGSADNLLLAIYLSARCPIVFAPAMDLDMYAHPATKTNIKELEKRGNTFIPAEKGELASGLEGEGRMAEPEKIIQFLHKYFATGMPLKGKKVLVTAGPTQELIDPVRFIGNHSSGKMGFALAEAAAALGAEVQLVTGKVNLITPTGNVNRVDVSSANEMYNACLELYDECDIAVLSAAVADFRPKKISKQKIKKRKDVPKIELEPTEDILKTLGSKKRKGQVLVGFALETENEKANATKKLKEKNLDFIVLNSLKEKGAGFGGDDNKVYLIDGKESIELPLKSKKEIAKDIFEKVIEIIKN